MTPSRIDKIKDRTLSEASRRGIDRLAKQAGEEGNSAEPKPPAAPPPAPAASPAEPKPEYSDFRPNDDIIYLGRMVETMYVSLKGRAIGAEAAIYLTIAIAILKAGAAIAGAIKDLKK